MRAEIINVGDEVLLGYVLNENARFLACCLASAGIELTGHWVVGDQEQSIAGAFQQAWHRADLLIFTGGLGTTVDDLTKRVVAGELGIPLEVSRSWEGHLEKLYARVGVKLDEKRRGQALIPQGCRLVPNENGTAPGIIIEKGGKVVVLLPGPPGELKPMVEGEVLPYWRELGAGKIIKTRILKVVGLGEATLEDRLRGIIDGEGNPRVVLMAQSTENHVYITAQGRDTSEVEGMIRDRQERIRERLGSYLYGEDQETLEAVVARHLFRHNYTLAVAESCTGGLLADRLTDIPGSSAYFLRGIVCYSDQAKRELLQVPREVLDRVGAVSEEAARAMAGNLRQSASADFSLATTGYAGPAAGPGEPVGLVYIALGTPGGTSCHRYNFWGDRRSIKEQAAVSALDLLRLHLVGPRPGTRDGG